MALNKKVLRETSLIEFLIEKEDEAIAVQFTSIADLVKDEGEKVNLTPYETPASKLGIPVEEMSVASSSTLPDVFDAISKIKEVGTQIDPPVSDEETPVEGPILFNVEELAVVILEVQPTEEGTEAESSIFIKTTDIDKFNQFVVGTKDEEGTEDTITPPADNSNESPAQD